MPQSLRALLHKLHKFSRFSLALCSALSALTYTTALSCFAWAPHTSNYFATLRFAQEATETAPALLCCGIIMAVIGQLVLSRREDA